MDLAKLHSLLGSLNVVFQNTLLDFPYLGLSSSSKVYQKLTFGTFQRESCGCLRLNVPRM